MGWLSAVINIAKAIAAFLGLVRQQSELAAGRAEQRADDDEARIKAEAEVRAEEIETSRKHQADKTDKAFDPRFWRD